MKLDDKGVDKVVKKIEELADDEPVNLNDLQVIIVGYELCPFTSLAKRVSKEYAPPNTSLLVGFDRGRPAEEFKASVGYEGTFPIVLVRDPEHGRLEHKGGGEDFEKWVKTHPPRPTAQAQSDHRSS